MRPVRNQAPRRRLRRLSQGLFGMGLALSLSGCLFSPGKEDPKVVEPVILPQTSAENVLKNLIIAYEAQDYLEYEKLFDEAFFFAFDIQDVAENPDIPVEWGKEDDVLSTRKMFDEPLVEKITLDFQIGQTALAEPADVLRHDFPPGTVKVTVSQVQLDVDTRDPKGGENIILQVAGDQAIFFLYPHPTEKVGTLPKWYIVEWRDRKIGGLLALL